MVATATTRRRKAAALPPTDATELLPAAPGLPDAVAAAIARGNPKEAREAARSVYPPESATDDMGPLDAAAGETLRALAEARAQRDEADRRASLLEAEVCCLIGTRRGLEGDFDGVHYRALWPPKSSGGGIDLDALRKRAEEDVKLAKHLKACAKPETQTRAFMFQIAPRT